MINEQQEIARRNTVLRGELCSSALARSLGITEVTAASLKQFDQDYFGHYPYLSVYVL